MHEPRDRVSIWYLGPRMGAAAILLGIAPLVALVASVMWSS